MAGGNSYNGWPASDDPSAINVDRDFQVDGAEFPGGVKAGDVSKVLGYVATQLDKRVEPIVVGWNWGWSYKQNVNNPSQLSCHSSSTAIDFNAPNHPNGSGGTFTSSQRATIMQILAEVENSVDWLEGYDEMHFEISVTASTLAGVASRLPDSDNGGDDDMPLSDSDIEKVADAVIKHLREDEVVHYNKTDAGSGKETQVEGSVTDALGTAATYAGRAAYRSTSVDNKT